MRKSSVLILDRSRQILADYMTRQCFITNNNILYLVMHNIVSETKKYITVTKHEFKSHFDSLEKRLELFESFFVVYVVGFIICCVCI